MKPFKLYIFAAFLMALNASAAPVVHDECLAGLAYPHKGPRPHKGVNECKDGMFAFYSPSSEGFMGMEGKCGQVLASELIYSYCDKAFFDPSGGPDLALKDPTPGVAPSTMVHGMNDLFEELNKMKICPTGRWRLFDEAANGNVFLWSVYDGLTQGGSGARERTRTDNTKMRVTPVGVMVDNGTDLHWVMVVDIENILKPKKCTVFYMSSTTEWRVSCGEFEEMAKKPGDKMTSFATGRYVRIKFIEQKPGKKAKKAKK